MNNEFRLPQKEYEFFLIERDKVGKLTVQWEDKHPSSQVTRFYVGLEAQGYPYLSLIIDFSSEVLHETLHSFDRRLPKRYFDPYEVVIMAGRAFRVSKGSESTNEGFVVHTGNVSTLYDFESDLSIVDRRVEGLFSIFYKALPNEALTVEDIFVSSNFPLDTIVSRMAYFKRRGIIKPFFHKSMTSEEMEIPLMSSQWERIKLFAGWNEETGYLVTDEGLEKLGAFVNQDSYSEHSAEHRYFKVVDIPNIEGKKFAFVLMPLKNEEFDQTIYTDAIKPAVEENFKLKCIHAGEITDPRVINDQIYSCILKADVIIAEVTSENANVLIEIGMSLALSKTLFIFTQNDLKELPFDIKSIRAFQYTDKDDIKGQIVQKVKSSRPEMYLVKEGA